VEKRVFRVCPFHQVKSWTSHFIASIPVCVPPGGDFFAPDYGRVDSFCPVVSCAIADELSVRRAGFFMGETS
jgi:hypothetical protein